MSLLASNFLNQELTTAAGQTLTVSREADGSRRLTFNHRLTVDLSPEEAHELVDILSLSPLDQELRLIGSQVPDLVFDWVQLPYMSPLTNHAIARSALRHRTGAAIIAIIRDHQTIAAPRSNEHLFGGDTLVICGTSESIRQAKLIVGGYR